MNIFQYTNNDFNYYIFDHSLSEFDNLLIKNWLNAYNKDCFKYKLNLNEKKKIGYYGILIQLCVERGKIKRKPQNIQYMNQKFNPNEFNFNKIGFSEEIFHIKRSDSSQKAKIIINISPLGIYHSLVIPSVESCHPQTLTKHSIQDILELVLLSKSIYLRVAFNSLCAFASVNHLHFHIYYLNEKMYLESIKVKHLCGLFYEFEDYPSKGFVIQIEEFDFSRAVKDLYRVIECFNEKNIAHNIFITRGESLNKTDSKDNIIRVFLWARRSEIGCKENDALNIAACELFGHFVVKEKQMYEEISESDINILLRNTCETKFQEARIIIKSIFT